MAATTFDTVTSRLRSSSALVTVASHGDRAGSVARFHSQCGVDPICYAVWLPARSHVSRVSQHATHIAIHVLDDGCEAIEEPSTAGGDLDAEWFDQCEWRPGPGGVPLFATRWSYLVLGLVSARLEHGGYACLIGELVHAAAGSDSAPRTPGGRDGTRAEPRLVTIDARRFEGQADPIGAMDAETRRQFINAAIGAGHAIDLPSQRERA
jgi:flavin reductase (DIM6/NTAB) family NADH-FMN oxidoreductase RutF